jgi:hypothetical protein
MILFLPKADVRPACLKFNSIEQEKPLTKFPPRSGRSVRPPEKKKREMRFDRLRKSCYTFSPKEHLKDD